MIALEPTATFVAIVEQLLAHCGSQSLPELRNALARRLGPIGERELVHLGWALCELEAKHDLDVQIASKPLGFDSAMRRALAQLPTEQAVPDCPACGMTLARFAGPGRERGWTCERCEEQPEPEPSAEVAP